MDKKSRNTTEANRYCAVAYPNTSVYVGSNKICEGSFMPLQEN